METCPSGYGALPRRLSSAPQSSLPPLKRGQPDGITPNYSWGHRPHTPALGVSQGNEHLYINARSLAGKCTPCHTVKVQVVFFRTEKISTFKPLTVFPLPIDCGRSHISFLERWGVQGGTPCILAYR